MNQWLTFRMDGPFHPHPHARTHSAPMSLAPLAYLLWTKVMKYNPKNPEWISRDRFVLSNGHACALLYR